MRTACRITVADRGGVRSSNNETPVRTMTILAPQQGQVLGGRGVAVVAVQSPGPAIAPAGRRSVVFGLDAESRSGGRARSLWAGHAEVPGPGTGHRIRLPSVHVGHRLQLAASDTPRPRHTSLALKNGKSNAFANDVADTIELGSQVARSPIARSRVCLT